MIEEKSRRCPLGFLKLLNPQSKEQRRRQPSQPGHGEEQRLKGVEGAKLLCLHSQAPTASEEGTTVTQKHQEQKPSEHQGSY